MKTRVGKIARLPHHIREELNQRLFNGALGPELSKWLNALPKVKKVLAEFFASSPINRQNLTEWRQGGYEEWLRHQEHELRIKRLVEEGESLGKHDADSDDDLFEHSSRIALAELMTDFDSLHELKGEERTNRLRTLTRELTRLQYAYNHSRLTALAYSKWNQRFLGPDDYEDEQEDTPAPETQTPSHIGHEPAPRSAAVPAASSGGVPPPVHATPTPIEPRSADFQSAVSPSCTRQVVTIAEAPKPPTPTPNSDLPTPITTPEFKPHQTTSTTGEVQTGAPACSRLTAQTISTQKESDDECNHPISRHSPSRDEIPILQPPPSAISQTLADFSRRMALLKTSGQFP